MPEGLELAGNNYRRQRNAEDSEHQRRNNPEHGMAFNEGAVNNTQPVHYKNMQAVHTQGTACQHI
jgi:hypothetical protein